MTRELTRQLSETAARKLIARINAGIEDVASLLIQLHDGKGWAAMGYESWKACCLEEFGRSASWASRQIKAAEIRAALPIGNDLPESHARELASLPPENRREVYEAAKEEAGRQPTAREIREKAAELFGDEPTPEQIAAVEEMEAEGEDESIHSTDPTPLARYLETVAAGAEELIQSYGVPTVSVCDGLWDILEAVGGDAWKPERS